MNPIEQPLDAREARNNALEEAARVCDEQSLLQRQTFAPLAVIWTTEWTAARIRALKSQEPPK